MTAEIGLIGLAVMGENLVLNIESRGYTVAVFNRTVEKVRKFASGRGKDKKFVAAESLEEFAKSLKRPRKVIMMIKAGSAVDETIAQVLPHLEAGDILIDGGNSHFADTTRRQKELEAKGFHFVGCGISGGEEGALHGPSMMPGGSPAAWPAVKEIFQAISAKVEDGTPCCDWVGQEGAGHFVKMVHNGIEYGDIQLICEAYQLMKEVVGLSNDEMQKVFNEWNQGDLDSYLIEITTEILGKKDEEQTDKYVVDLILDVAGQKGTGKWTLISAADLGMPLTMIGEAVFARCISALKEDRVTASKLLPSPPAEAFKGNKENFLLAIRDALFASKIVSYAQGYLLMRAASREFGWDLNYGGIALMWRGGCIIRSKFLGRIKEAFDKDPNLENLILDQYFISKLKDALPGWRDVASTAIQKGIPIPGMTSALTYFDALRSERLPANLLQAQRDYFGAHTYERVDKPRGQFFHTNWTGRGGSTSSSTYNA